MPRRNIPAMDNYPLIFEFGYLCFRIGVGKEKKQPSAVMKQDAKLMYLEILRRLNEKEQTK